MMVTLLLNRVYVFFFFLNGIPFVDVVVDSTGVDSRRDCGLLKDNDSHRLSVAIFAENLLPCASSSAAPIISNTLRSTGEYLGSTPNFFAFSAFISVVFLAFGQNVSLR
uniref:Uncharacterized protein n=1 Tax=Cacopsylla melanoneura TaxID=428564 RepID=A0A8D8YPX3_9HEMI